MARLVPSPGILIDKHDNVSSITKFIRYEELYEPITPWIVTVTSDRSDYPLVYNGSMIIINRVPVIKCKPTKPQVEVGWDRPPIEIFPMEYVKYLYSDNYEDRSAEIPSDVKVTQNPSYGISADYTVTTHPGVYNDEWDNTKVKSQVIESLSPTNPIINITISVTITGMKKLPNNTLVPITLSGKYIVRVTHIYDTQKERLLKMVDQSLYQLRDIGDYMDSPSY